MFIWLTQLTQSALALTITSLNRLLKL